MVAPAPKLTSKVIVEEAARRLLPSRLEDLPQASRPKLVAFYGSGSLETLQCERLGKVEVVPVRSELELRSELPAFTVDPPYTVYLVPWQHDLPLDIAGRFAGRGRVFPIGPAQRLMALTGTKLLDAEVERSKLAGYLLAEASTLSDYQVPGSQLTMDTLCSVWLGRAWGLPGGELSADTLLAWAGTNERGQAFAAAMSQPSAAGVLEELKTRLKESLGVLGPLAIEAWVADKGTELLAYGVLCDAFVKGDGGLGDAAVAPWLAYRFGDAFPSIKQDVQAAAQALATATAGALRYLSRTADASGGVNQHKRIVAAAEALIHDNIRDKLVASSVLPTAWALRERRLGEALSTGAAALSAESVRTANDCLLELERHDFFRLADGDDLPLSFQRGEMAVRLLTWLVTKGDRLERRGLQAHADAEELAQWYVQEGGYVDWARHRARGGGDSALAKGVQAVVAQVDAIREELDQRFARALVAWHEAGRPSSHVVPIDKALEKIALPFLKSADPSKEPRRLLVLLMDGMAWAQAVELLQSMAEQAFEWGPLQWHVKHRFGASPFPPVLANLPTVTEVSRAAFFAGQLMKPGAKLSTEEDCERFAANTKLHPFCPAHRRPRLMLRAESHATDGGASQEALSLIRDKELGVVGIVVNAIDKSLSADIQQVTRWRVKDVKSLPTLLEAAREQGRYVLFCSDHGHVPADRFQPFGPSRPGPGRYRPYAGDPEVQPGELAFSGEGVYAEKDMDGAVLLTTDRYRYRNLPNAGEHGGASLAEVVTPCLLIGWPEPGTERDHPELVVTRPGEPSWWHRTLPSRATTVSEPPARPVSTRKKSKVDESQLGLPGLPSPELPPPSVVPVVTGDGAEDAFVACKMLVAREPKKERRIRLAKVVRFLLERNSASLDALAQHLDVPAYRMQNVVSTFTEVLNVDGYEVLRIDRKNRQIYLDSEKLVAQFGEESIR